MSCPYRTHAQFVNWLIRYKNWPKKEAQALNVHTMRKMYYSEPPIPKRGTNLPVKYNNDIMDFDEACSWYQEQTYLDSLSDEQAN
jgi:hypothetical protein